jgi:hypothetical protein
VVAGRPAQFGVNDSAARSTCQSLWAPCTSKATTRSMPRRRPVVSACPATGSSNSHCHAGERGTQRRVTADVLHGDPRPHVDWVGCDLAAVDSQQLRTSRSPRFLFVANHLCRLPAHAAGARGWVRRPWARTALQLPLRQHGTRLERFARNHANRSVGGQLPTACPSTCPSHCQAEANVRHDRWKIRAPGFQRNRNCRYSNRDAR